MCKEVKSELYFSDGCHSEALDRHRYSSLLRAPVSRDARGRLSAETRESWRRRCSGGTRQILHRAETLHQPHHETTVRKTRGVS